MPFAVDMEDVYHYGIQNAVHAVGYLRERADLSAFSGDVLQWIKDWIASADLVVAGLSYANPNVYLEIGFSWGRAKPTVLLMCDTKHLKFDVQGQRCLFLRTSETWRSFLRKNTRTLYQSDGVTSGYSYTARLVIANI